MIAEKMLAVKNYIRCGRISRMVQIQPRQPWGFEPLKSEGEILLKVLPFLYSMAIFNSYILTIKPPESKTSS